MSIVLGKDGNWDLLNYHFYTPYAALTGRMGVDLLPSQTQTFLNPLMDLPTYWLITTLPPVVVGGIMGAFQGLNLLIIYHLTRRVFPALPPWQDALVPLAVTLLAATGSIVRGLWGTFMGDLTMSIFILGALYLFVTAAEIPAGRRRMWALLGAGLVMGAGTGLKMTALLHAIPLVGLSIVLGRAPLDRAKALLTCAAGFAGGFLLTYGWWAVMMQARYGSPMFPYFNGIFQSPYALPHNLTDFQHWMPKSLAGHLALPFSFLLPGGGAGQAEVPFREWRPGIAFVALALFAVVLLWQLLARRIDLPRTKIALLLAAFFVGSWGLWQAQFAYYRYLAALELLAPLLVVAIIAAVLPRVWTVPLTLGVLLMLLPTTIPMDYGRRPWSDDYFEVHISPELNLDGAQVLIADVDRPLGYLVPFLPPSAQVIRLTSNMDPLLFGADQHGRLLDDIVAQVDQPRPKYVMFVNRRSLNAEGGSADPNRAAVAERVQAVLGTFGLTMTEQPPCPRIVSLFHTVQVCRVERSTQ